MAKKQKGATTLSKRAPTRIARNTVPSVVTLPVLDIVEHSLDSDLRGDTGMDLASCMDMMMSMIVALSKKVSDLNQVLQPQPVTAPAMLAASRHEPVKNRGQTG